MWCDHAGMDASLNPELEVACEYCHWSRVFELLCAENKLRDHYWSRIFGKLRELPSN